MLQPFRKYDHKDDVPYTDKLSWGYCCYYYTSKLHKAVMFESLDKRSRGGSVGLLKKQGCFVCASSTALKVTDN